MSAATLLVIILAACAVVVAVLLLICRTYFLPFFVGLARGHHDLLTLFILNLLFGMTFVGWWLCLWWAFKGRVKDEKGDPMWVPKQNYWW
jgi:hypothetical protein